MRPSLELAGMLKTSVATNVMVSCPVQIIVVRKFTGSTGVDIQPSATVVHWLTGKWSLKSLGGQIDLIV
jgi:hypothetical protein